MLKRSFAKKDGAPVPEPLASKCNAALSSYRAATAHVEASKAELAADEAHLRVATLELNDVVADACKAMGVSVEHFDIVQGADGAFALKRKALAG